MKEENISPEEGHMHQTFDDALNDLYTLDRKLNGLNSNKDPAPRPAAMKFNWTSQTKNFDKYKLNLEKEKTIRDAQKDIKKIIEHAPSETKGNMVKQLEDWYLAGKQTSKPDLQTAMQENKNSVVLNEEEQAKLMAFDKLRVDLAGRILENEPNFHHTKIQMTKDARPTVDIE